ncbi:MAG: hypothetical protein UV79_C0002G0017 [candidate division TM6 bacterium GW2011_GWF2_43_17]|nr:MAG: hypothetical protein UV79_C0002G0017 [candidate division TM6 bacterium GW2011_GWF2_43_17]HAU30168.1 hypothetical protein [Candidatus Dependentiae bacterium]
MKFATPCLPECLELVLFDNDGVLVDSELISFEVYAEKISAYGIPKTALQLMEETSGLTHEAIIEQSIPGITIQERDILGISIHEEIKKQFALAPLRPNNGVIELLTQLQRKNILFCVATNGKKDRLDSAFRASGLDKFFPEERRFTAYMVAKGKPEPDLYLFAAQQCGVSPKNCLVIEDSITGITAAQRAKMPVIAYLGASHAQQGWYRDWVLSAQPTCRADSMEKIQTLFDAI